ncbi:Karyopherin transporter [Tulasnella sp. 427]|nr:Karyopherin transporter [Tulasnella sp. 427]
MEHILDFNQELNVALLDQVVTTFYSGTGPQQLAAQQVLTQFQDNPDAWQRVPAIMETSSNMQSKVSVVSARFIALQIMDKLITTRWKALPEDQRGGIRNFIINTIIVMTSDENTFRTYGKSEKAYLHKLNLVLIQILKQEWPHNWPTFITEIVSSSKTSLSLCENNMVILKLLSEEIFDFSAEQMTQAKVKNLKNQMCGEFSEIFQLCIEVLDKAQKPSLIKATLDTMLRFLNWIPLGYIFETKLIDTLTERFLEVPDFRNVTLKCLSEVAALVVGAEYDPKFGAMFSNVMVSVNKMVPPSTNVAEAYATSSDDDQELILNLALFLSNFLSNHLKIIESETHKDLLVNSHMYMIKISQVDDREVFKICLEYWAKLVADLYEEMQALPVADLVTLNLGAGTMSGLSAGFGGIGVDNSAKLRKNVFYADVLSQLRLVMVGKMVKPEEVLIVENDEGEIVREFMKESDTIVLYKQMREVLVYLTHLDVNDTENILTEKLARQIDGSEWSWANINTLCWAIGSISGAMNEETEKRFLVSVIKDLLGLTEMKRGKDNKAVVASNIMYIVGQYPRFLKAHWKFLKTVVNKLFEFMHETHEGVQDMACDTFIKIAQKCRRHFVMQQAGETEPFIDEILRNLHRITMDLSPQQVHTFYEAIGYMVAAQPNKPVQERLLAKLMELPNNAWDGVMEEAKTNLNVLDNADKVKLLGNVLKTNVAACGSIGPFFFPQLGRIFLDMLGLYKEVSTIINNMIALPGANVSVVTRMPKVRGLRTIKREVLKLVECYIKKAEDLEAIAANLSPPLLDAVLGDYNRNYPEARDAEVLNVMTTIMSRMGSLLTHQVPPIMEAVFDPTLSMITRDFADFPEHRVGLYKLLRTINLNCFPALLTLPPEQFKLFMDAVMWAIKHTMRDIADTGLNLCLEVVNNFASAEPPIANIFFKGYYLSILQDTFFVLTDTDHKFGFKLQTQLLARLFSLVELNQIQTPLFDPATVADPEMTNPRFLRGYCGSLLKNAFPHLSSLQIESFVLLLCEHHSDINKFKLATRDFLIQLKEFAGDNADLFLEEKELEGQRKAQEEREAAARVPGLLKPSQIKDEDEEL